MPVKEYVGVNKGNPRAGNDKSSSTRPSNRAHNFYDVFTGEQIDHDVVMKSPIGTIAIDLTPVIHKTIVDLVAQGNFLKTAVAASGISYDTFKRWMRKAYVLSKDRYTAKELKEAKPYICLMQDISRATAQAEIDKVKIIDEAAKDGKWDAARWWLERTAPDRWGRKELISHTGEIKHVHEVAQKILADPDATEKAIDIFEQVTDAE